MVLRVSRLWAILRDWLRAGYTLAGHGTTRSGGARI
jgi:hypothetical protein